jgi:hypothetical protein
VKSPMIEDADYIPDKGNYSELRVLRSGAGYYIGTTYTHGPGDEFPGLVEPGSRDSGYYATEAEAAAALAGRAWEQRAHP